MTARGENPFCSTRIRPGAMPFLFADKECPAILLQRLEENGWQGQIVGPHGSGKSSVIATLLPILENAGHNVRLVTLHDGQRKMPQAFFDASAPSGALVIVDGYEQLARWQRFRLRRFCRQRCLGLLVTCHRSLGFPEILRTAPTIETIRRVVAELQQGYPAYVTSEDVVDANARHGGNLRELLFELYDLYRKRKISASPGEKRY